MTRESGLAEMSCCWALSRSRILSVWKGGRDKEGREEMRREEGRETEQWRVKRVGRGRKYYVEDIIRQGLEEVLVTCTCIFMYTMQRGIHTHTLYMHMHESLLSQVERLLLASGLCRSSGWWITSRGLWSGDCGEHGGKYLVKAIVQW